MEKEVKINKKAPTAIGPYSPALKVGNLINKEKFPARSCVEVSRLPKDAEIEIEAIAFCI